MLYYTAKLINLERLQKINIAIFVGVAGTFCLLPQFIKNRAKWMFIF